MKYQDRWYQTAAKNSIFEYFQHKQGNPIVAMPKKNPIASYNKP